MEFLMAGLLILDLLVIVALLRGDRLTSDVRAILIFLRNIAK